MSRFGRLGGMVAGIGAAIGVASLAGIVLTVLVARYLSPADYVLFTSFWGVIFGIGGALSIVEQEAARQTTPGSGESRSTVHVVAACAAVPAALLAAVTLLPPVAARQYGLSDPTIGLVVLLGAIGFAAQFAVRGTLIGTGAVRHYAGIVVAEAVLRLVVLVALALTVGIDLRTAAIAVGVGSFVWVAWAGRAWRAMPRAHLDAAVWRTTSRRTASLMVAAALNASVITGYPALVRILSGAEGPAVGAVLAALTVSRVPLLLVSPVQAVTVPAVVRWRASGGSQGKLRRLLILGTTAAVVSGVLGGAVGWLWGPWVVRTVFRRDYVVTPGAVGVLVFSAFLLAWVLLMSAALVALAAYRRMTLLWLAAAGSTVVWLAVSPLGGVDTTVVGGLVGPVVATALGFYALWSLTWPTVRDVVPVSAPVGSLPEGSVAEVSGDGPVSDGPASDGPASDPTTGSASS